jgi:hypothetical protein
MNKLLILLAAIVTAHAAAATSTAPAPGPASSSTRTYSYWLHPKLGMVKVDRSTHAMVVAKRQEPDAAQRAAR